MLHTPRAYRGMVTSPHHLASQAGLRVLQDGGGAAEAAVAVAACLAAVYPHMTGIGGDSFWLVAEPSGETWSVNSCGAAAAGADRALYERAGCEAVPWRGPLAANTAGNRLAKSSPEQTTMRSAAQRVPSANRATPSAMSTTAVA